jgi:hypothetical protein
VALIGLALATAGAASASVVSAPTATAAVRWHVYTELGSTASSDPNKIAAVDAAEQLLGTVKVGTDWTAVPVPPTHLSFPGTTPATFNLVDRYGLWTTTGTWEELQAWFASHVPPGARLAESQRATGSGGVESSGIAVAFPIDWGRFQLSQLEFEVAPLGGGDVGIRIDAQVVWYPSRPRSERVPAGANRVTATIYRDGGIDGRTKEVLGTATFTSPPIVRMLAHRVDRLPLSVPGVRNCPAEIAGEAQLTLVFSGRAGVPKVVVDDDPTGCRSVTFAIGGKVQASLTDDGLFQQVQGLLGLHLTGQ